MWNKMMDLLHNLEILNLNLIKVRYHYIIEAQLYRHIGSYLPQ